MMIRYENKRIRYPGEDLQEKLPMLQFPHCGIEGWAGAVAIGAGALAAGATAYGATQSANAQKDAANQAAQSQKNANQLNYQMFQESRGSNGSAVLPTYLKGSNGGLFESQLGGDLTKAYGDTAIPLSDFQAATGRLKPAQNGAVDFTNGIFNGGVTNTMLSNAAPVQQARLATARSSSLDALHKTLDQIDAQQASRGYVGDSYGNRLLSFQAGKQAGDAIGSANLENAQQTADIRNYGNVTLPLNNITLPYSMAQTVGQNQFLPNDLYLQSIGQRMQPLNMLKIGYTGPFQYQPLPTPGPGAYSGGANALSALGGGISGIGGAAMQYYMGQQNQKFQSSLLNQLQYGNSGIAASGSTLPGNGGGSYSDYDIMGNPVMYQAAQSGTGFDPSLNLDTSLSL